ncbi:MAG: hypothetical protein QW692_02215 [Nitrososphaerota archaeon]
MITSFKASAVKRPLVEILKPETAYLDEPASAAFNGKDFASFMRIMPDGVMIRGTGFTVLDVLLAAIYGNGYEQIAIIGDFGSGKSTLASWLVYAVFSALGAEDPWKEVGIHTVFKIEEFEERVKMYRGMGMRAPIILWDDAGLHLSKYRHFEEGIKILTDFMQAIREDVAVLLFTMNETSDILRRIRTKFTGEIFCEKKYVKVGGVPMLVRGRAYFSIRDRLVSFNRLGETYDRKIIVHGLPGCELEFPKLPPEYEAEYLQRKNQAREDVNIKRYAMAAKREASKLISLLGVMGITVLRAISAICGDDEEREFTIRDVMRKLMEQGIEVSTRELERRLKILRACELIVSSPIDHMTYKLTGKGVMAIETLREEEAASSFLSKRGGKLLCQAIASPSDEHGEEG